MRGRWTTIAGQKTCKSRAGVAVILTDDNRTPQWTIKSNDRTVPRLVRTRDILDLAAESSVRTAGGLVMVEPQSVSATANRKPDKDSKELCEDSRDTCEDRHKQ